MTQRAKNGNIINTRSYSCKTELRNIKGRFKFMARLWKKMLGSIAICCNQLPPANSGNKLWKLPWGSWNLMKSGEFRYPLLSILQTYMFHIFMSYFMKFLIFNLIYFKNNYFWYTICPEKDCSLWKDFDHVTTASNRRILHWISLIISISRETSNTFTR